MSQRLRWWSAEAQLSSNIYSFEWYQNVCVPGCLVIITRSRILYKRLFVNVFFLICIMVCQQALYGLQIGA